MRNKLIIFDLDGVLIESRELHYHALNDALLKIGGEFVIQREEHLSVFDGLNTTRKLEMLTERKGLPTSVYDQVWQDKQIATFELIKQFPKSPNLIRHFSELKKQGIKHV